MLIALIQDAAPVAAPRLLPNVIMIAAFISIFYFLLLRPQRKIQQQHREMLAALKKGDEVMTDGGIIGQIVHLAEDRATIKTAENTRIVVSRTKISRVLTADTGEVK
ncbi:MAG TPA: preprotein translocase subunit YajC [Longimicrobiales bacterium]|nr:preprotein translocase subunit YajC [Longimicrobiales bacterium]